MKTNYLNHINIRKDKTTLNYLKTDKDLGRVEKMEEIETPFKIIEYYHNDDQTPADCDWTCITLHRELVRIFPDLMRIELHFGNYMVDDIIVNTIVLVTKKLSIKFDELTKNGKVKNMLDCSLTRRVL